MKLISIIIPVYNAKQYIKRCLDSILNQGFSNYEIILIDDGSNDGSELIVDQYRNKNIIVIHEINKGPAFARNSGLSYATGKYVWFIDADDEIEQDSLEIMNKILEMEEADILFFNYRLITNTEEIVSIRYKSDYYVGGNLIPFRSYLIRNSFAKLTTCCMQLYKREMISDLKFYSDKEVGYEDTIFCICAFLKAKSIRTTNDIFYRYYRKETGQSKTVKRSTWHNINSYLATKKTAVKCGTFDLYKNDLLYLFLERSVFGCNGKYPSIIIAEYIKYQSEAHDIVKQMLDSKEMEEMLLDADEYPKEEISSEIYQLLLNKDEHGLYHYLGNLIYK